jgi:NADPH-dependent 2,4-dienoyl-CoA reductase/sulfur reductase-like enzyme/rhodanese-related sulfurtransferase/two-component sensor histidine kinase
VESIKRSSNELQSLIMDIMELERFKSGDVVLEPVDFTEICKRIIDELRDKIHEKNIKFDSDIPHAVLIVSGSPTGLKHAVGNLVENAVKYSQRDGKVGFSLVYDESKKTVTMTVRDSGIGIPEQAIEHIFEEFYRAPNARKFDQTGTGFGLAIVREIIEICGGKINLESKENAGTIITVEMTLLAAKEPELLNVDLRKKSIVVIGGVAAGPKAASRARRIDPSAKITIYEKENFLAYSGCALPYYISGRLKNLRDLFLKHGEYENTTEYFRDVKGIEIKNLCEVISIDRNNKRIKCREILTDHEFDESYDKLVLATGSRPNIPPIDGVKLGNILVLHGITDSERIKRAVGHSAAKDITIIGGGKIGVEIAEALATSGGRITIIEKEPEILPFLDREMASLIRIHMERKGVRIITGETVKAFSGKEKVEHILLPDYKLPTDLVILAAGFSPNVKLAKDAGLKIGPTGAISIDEFLMTSDDSIYAAGDCVEVIHVVSGKPVNIPLGSLANRQGRVAGTNAAGGKQKFGTVTGTTVIKVFGYNFAKTGLTEKEALEAGFTPVNCYLPEYDREPFFDIARMINIKMTADRSTGRLLGVQIVGEGEVDKRVDVAATVIANKGSINDVISLDLGYTPAYAQAIDNLITAAHIIQNKMDGLFEGIVPGDAEKVLNMGKEYVCIDVRTPREFEEERIPGCNLIPLGSLRRRLDEIPSDREIILICETGGQSYQASLILKSNGFKKVKILEGGLRMLPYRVIRE